ncbi:MAG: sulfotransferase domain-containing protein [Deltaproteobacteria bacterium]|nr:sulfotransferase domain-containing protein [Deltaproteobacteria bacterium]
MLPNFLIIGAQKSGTTSLYHYLRQHPEIYMSPEKEPRFFAFEGDKSGRYPYTSLKTYEKLFDNVQSEKAVGEGSTYYLFSRKAPSRIKHYIPDIKMIAVLRNPIERAYSQYLFLIREGREQRTDFRQVIQDEKYLMDTAPTKSIYLARGLYGEQIQRYLALFSKEQLRIYLYDHFKTQPLSILQDIFSYLSVDTEFVPDISLNYNVSVIPRNKTIHLLLGFISGRDRIKSFIVRYMPQVFYVRIIKPGVNFLLGTLRSRKPYRPPPMPNDLRCRLADFYAPDIALLEKILDIDLAGWISPGQAIMESPKNGG